VDPPFGFNLIHAADLVQWHGERGHEGFQQLLNDLAQYVPARVSPQLERNLRRKPKLPSELSKSASIWWAKRILLPGRVHFA
jgi:hypothetical protein